MKVYVVFGIEWHIGRELLGVYDSKDRAATRKKAMQKDGDYDEIVINEFFLNEDTSQ